MSKLRRIDIMNTKIIALALTAALILAATVLSGACVEKVSPCAEFDDFAEIYAPTCPAVEAWSTSCASNLAEMLPEVRQNFDWCVDCYRDLNADPDLDCSTAPLDASPLGAACPTLLNAKLDATCNWPIPVL